MTGIRALSDPTPLLYVGYDHDDCDGVQNSVFQAALLFDFSRLSDIPRKLITKAELHYDERPQAQRAPGGTPIIVSNCATRLAPSDEDHVVNWIHASHQRSRQHAIDGQGWYLIHTDDGSQVPLNGNAVNVTPIVLSWLTGRRENQGFVLRGDIESVDGDHDACASDITNIELVVEYIAL
jgi:hypothetical protein